jgi:hypothetical protein
MIAPRGRRNIRSIETIQAVNLTSPPLPKGKVLATALVMHSYLPNLAGLPICLEISKFFKKKLVKNVQFRYGTTGKFFSPPPVANISGKIFLGALFNILKCPKKPVPRPPNLLILPTPLMRK